MIDILAIVATFATAYTLVEAGRELAGSSRIGQAILVVFALATGLGFIWAVVDGAFFVGRVVAGRDDEFGDDLDCE